MRRRVAVAVGAGALLAGCNLFGTSVPSGFDGFFHLDRPGRATSLNFVAPDLMQVRDLGCDGLVSSDQTWAADGDQAIVATDWPGQPRFTRDPDGQALVASPGLYGPSPERWVPGATCLTCAADAGADAGVVSACDLPAYRDGGT